CFLNIDFDQTSFQKLAMSLKQIKNLLALELNIGANSEGTFSELGQQYLLVKSNFIYLGLNLRGLYFTNENIKQLALCLKQCKLRKLQLKFGWYMQKYNLRFNFNQIL
ncbi:hypothetical protein TTHERM_002653516, partial (macronuclear) [Tetrahymena thermophila SB210]